MKFVIIGGSGLIGSKVCKNLQDLGHEVISASPSTGINVITGEGLADALKGADVVVDVANSPSFEDHAALHFFETAGHNLFAAEKVAGTKHHVALSVVGTERMLDSGYFRAKMAQEKLVKASGVPYTILRATQFFEFIGAIAYSGREDGNTIHLTSAALQPVASVDVAAALTAIAQKAPTHQTVEVAGPDRRPIVEFVNAYLKHTKDPREAVPDDTVPYFGAPIDDKSLTPGDNPIVGATRFEDWLETAHPS
ncbi:MULTISPECIES: SDR family oxidoreductase [unclassified Pseudomonas]|uniref:SDR family oxidoreductase n=1 Tax=unclassified Pseudomonas TaxID=196821 RepID=UPI000C87BFED|nr:MULTISPECIES: SDR family oxidoreductase [unclassified Pseudomonas]PMU12667.1 NmrA family transcriptional regulator [Pseudomonas sp. FW305-20]PMU22203.1 NmrA family transcriptional regulator [Pseudomonas sp. FW305-122]PMU43407.1 NmrA family transcriptional regulator [Pseudomonas sp. FW305-47B]PMX57717.1 NmrA family transcriptional regulator [Pseudomonas sp. FW305-33]PMX64735.1 NmrA family transcriptional regulator [Pseudomonas sp. FW305-60]